MEYMRIQAEFPKFSNTAVTLGKFDGIHRGHQKLLKVILERKAEGCTAVMCTFEAAKEMILSRTERIRILEKMGLDALLECPLNEEIRRMRAESFVKEILVGALDASFVAVGEDFRFGHERKGTPQLLTEMGRKYGFEVAVIPKEMEGRRKISSTYLREELRYGNMEKFRSLMGMGFITDGIVEHGRGLGHKKLLPTVNLIPPKEKLMPPNGVYYTISRVGGREYCGVTNVGYKPTVGEAFLGVETYLFDCAENLYGEFCSVEFCHFARPEQKFHTLEELKTQILRDAEGGRVYFEQNRPNQNAFPL